MTPGPLDGRTALVTGGGRGIGRAVAEDLAAAGAAIVVNYRRDAEAAEKVVEAIHAAGGTAVAIQGSVGDADEVDALADAVLGEVGTVDILVNNAGIASRGQRIVDSDPLEFDRLLAINALGPMRLIQRIVPGMRRCPRGDVVMISSSEVANMRANGGPYNMAKSAMEALALTLAMEEIAHGIHVNIVAPGLVATDMGDRLVRATLGLDGARALDAELPLGHVCRPLDVARVVTFLVSEGSHYVTGQRIVVDGGADVSPTGGKAATPH